MLIPYITVYFRDERSGDEGEVITEIVDGDIEDVKKEYVKFLFDALENIDMAIKYVKNNKISIIKYFQDKNTMTLEEFIDYLDNIDEYIQHFTEFIHSFTFFYEGKWQKIDYMTDGIIEYINSYYQS